LGGVLQKPSNQTLTLAQSDYNKVFQLQVLSLYGNGLFLVRCMGLNFEVRDIERRIALTNTPLSYALV
jgi:hypothetical protein